VEIYLIRLCYNVRNVRKEDYELYRLLIVDDEKLDREGLVEQIDWTLYGITVVETAKNAYDALRILQNYKPHILITDVKMSGMNGLQLVEQVKKDLPSVKVVFISGYDDFNYIKTALRLDAYEYILKPVRTIELEETAKRVTDELNKELCAIKEKEEFLKIVDNGRIVLREKFFNDLIYGTYKEEDLEINKEKLHLNMTSTIFVTVLLEIDDCMGVDEVLLESDRLNKQKSIKDYLSEYQVTENIIYIVELKSSLFALLFTFDDSVDYQKINTLLMDEAKKILQGIKDKTGISVTIALGNSVSNVEELYKSYTYCREVLSQKMFLGKGTILSKLENSDKNVKERKLFYEIDQELLTCVKNFDRDRMVHLIDYLFDEIEAEKLRNPKKVQDICINIVSRLQITLSEMNETVENIFGHGVVLWEKLLKIETIPDIRLWMKNIFSAIIEYLQEKNDKTGRRITEMVKEYVRENYEKDISLKEISARFFYSPNHLGAILKEELGKGFNEFLTEYRMKKAAELLEDPTKKIYEVANLVAYKSVTAFVNKFKEYYQLTPKEYQQKH